MAIEIVTWQWMKDWMVNAIDGINGMYNGCIDMFQKLNPYNLSGPSLGGTTTASAALQDIQTVVMDAVTSIALSLCILFFLMDFFRKSMDLQWVKWENILMFVLKLVFAKVILDNSAEIMEFIFTVFNDLAVYVSNNVTQGSGIIPVDPTIEDGLALSYSNFFLTAEEFQYYCWEGGGFLGLARMLKIIELQPSVWIAMGVMLVTGVMIFARMFEVLVYTMISPIPLSSFASDEHRQIGISFIKSYAAVCLQAVVIIVLFAAFAALGNELDKLQGTFASGSWGILLRVLVLGIGVFKSGSWAKKMCGAM